MTVSPKGPYKSAQEKKTKKVTVYLSIEEYEDLLKESASKGLRIGAFMRKKALNERI